jgi:putative flavoprotein involved in K+ transport
MSPVGAAVDVAVVGAGQAGLAAGRALQLAGLNLVILEAAPEVGGSWPDYYDSLRLFSPAQFSALPGLPLPGDPDRYPTRNEITDYLHAYADTFDLPVRTSATVTEVVRDGNRFRLRVQDAPSVTARAVIAASGGYGHPHVPPLPGLSDYTGRLLHTATYRRPESFAGQRVVVVGAGNSAVQIAVELAEVATVTLATREPIRFVPQTPRGIDVHYWTHWTRLEALPLGRRAATGAGVLDTGRYAAALAVGRPDRRPMFTRLTSTGIAWADGNEETVDAVILATGYRPDLRYLTELGALTLDGWPVHCRGISLTVPRLGYVGVPGQTGFASATVRGVGGDAHRVVRRLHRALKVDATKPATCRVPALASR